MHYFKIYIYKNCQALLIHMMLGKLLLKYIPPQTSSLCGITQIIQSVTYSKYLRLHQFIIYTSMNITPITAICGYNYCKQSVRPDNKPERHHIVQIM